MGVLYEFDPTLPDFKRLCTRFLIGGGWVLVDSIAREDFGGFFSMRMRMRMKEKEIIL